MMIFRELSAINVIVLYSSILLESMNSKSTGSFPITPRQGTYILGMVDLFGGTLAMYTVTLFSRKCLFLFGNFSIAICHMVIGMATVYGDAGIAFGGIVLFIFIFVNTSGPVCWIYADETVSDAGLGVVLLILWMTLFTLSFITPVLMSPDSVVGPTNLFFIFSGINFISTIYAALFIKETKGLSDKEKKLLYTPKEDRKLV